ncbi:MAG: ACP S-malonyltransferase [Desulfuromonadales bacterium]
MIGFVFPGQGAQHPGMGRELADNFKIAGEVFEEANDTLGFDLASMCFNGPEEDLKLTTNTQPAILAVSVAALRVLQQETDLTPSYVAGHSLGEYSALVCSGALSFADAVRTVRRRGAFMQEAVPVGEGAMAAIMGLDRETLEGVCAEAAQGKVVSPANYNSPVQIVIAGHADAVERACALASEKGAKRAVKLPVSAPFHCSLMVPAGERLEGVLAEVSVGEIGVPVVTNVEALPNEDPARVHELLVRQVSAPVRWAESVEAMAEQGVDNFVEIGPGKVLSGLIKRMVRGSTCRNLETPANLKALQS